MLAATMRFTSPAKNTVLTISDKPEWPALTFTTDATGAHTWRWTIAWKGFSQSGKAATEGPEWDAAEAIQDRGGTLTVKALAGSKQASMTVKIIGSNPSEDQVAAYLKDKTDGDTMVKLVRHESKFQQFRKNGEPVKSFDNGYGLTQVTNPKPKFEEVFNWQLNLDAGLRLYAIKKAAAIAYLSTDKRSYTDTQVQYETICRWNGGYYHVWDSKAGAWVRRSDVLCDTQTGNIGWDLGLKENQGKTEADLRKRDSGGYNAHTADSSWGYFGVCYADRVLG